MAGRLFIKRYIYRILESGLKIKRSEVTLVTWSFLYFFFLLSSYYVLRPIRDEMGIQGGVENLPWMFTGTFVATAIVVPVFGWIATNVSKRRIVPSFYGLFLLVVLVFFVLMKVDVSPGWTAIAFFIWISVFNLFVVSVFWSFMVDVYRPEQSERLFGFIAAGGTTGAILGPTLTAILPPVIGTENMLLVSAGLLLGTLLCINRILSLRSGEDSAGSGTPGGTGDEADLIDFDRSIGGNFLDGVFKLFKSPYLLGIGLFIVLYSATSTFVYFEQANIIERTVSSSARRTQVFAIIDFFVNVLTVVGQLFLTGRMMDDFGPGPSLLSLPLVTIMGFVGLAAAPVLVSIILFQVVRRSSNYALSKPAREVLFSPLEDSKKYKGKNVVDTLVYRGGDAVTGWAFAGLQGVGFSLAGISLVGAGLAIGWVVLCFGLIRSYREKSDS